MLAKPYSETLAPSPPGGRVFNFAGRARCLPRFLLGPHSADYAINTAGLAAAAILRPVCDGSGESGRRRELQARINGNDDGRLFDAGGVAELPGGEVRGAAGVADVNQAVYDLDVEPGG